MRVTKLKDKLVRRIEATDGTRKARPLFVELNTMGYITVWPRRCPAESMHLRDVYIQGNRLRKWREKMAKRKEKA